MPGALRGSSSRAIEFWGYWRGPCTGGSLPRLMKLYEKFEEKRDRFEILALHDTRAKTLEEMDEKLARVIRERWGGKELPFPILMDATGQTIKRYGIHKYCSSTRRATSSGTGTKRRWRRRSPGSEPAPPRRPDRAGPVCENLSCIASDAAISGRDSMNHGKRNLPASVTARLLNRTLP